MANSRPKGVKCLDQDKVAKLLFKVPYTFNHQQESLKQIVFVMGTGSGYMYFLKNFLNDI